VPDDGVTSLSLAPAKASEPRVSLSWAKRNTKIIAAILTLVIVLTGVMIVNSGPSFAKARDKILSKYSASWFTGKDASQDHADLVTAVYDCIRISSDGRSMTIDTNPKNYDQRNQILKYSAIHIVYSSRFVWDVNEFLGLPDSLKSLMEGTSAMMGRQSREYGKIRVSWTYHPDKGLSVIYERI